MGMVDEVRRFNRFYTRRIGLLNEHLPASTLSLAEARVLYELAHGSSPTAAEIGRRLAMDKAHLSRVLARFRKRGLVASRPSPDHGKHLLLSLTAAGRAAFAQLDRGTREQIDAMLRPLARDSRRRVLAAMREIRSQLDSEEPRDRQAPGVTLRGPAPGDIGWITHRQALLYHREYGWDWTYEALVADILAKFVAGYDAAHEEAWVAERDGTILGSVFLMRGAEPTEAKLRLLYVEPDARGLGLGRDLVGRCISRAKALGYRRLTLWTNDVLVAARKIYQSSGFRLIEESPHRSFGHDLVGQTWSLDLTA